MIMLNNLLNKTSKYMLLSEASIRSDMAERIMYSIISGLYGKESSCEIPLSYAIAGRHDIIRLGLKACIKELLHSFNQKYHNNAQNEFSAKNYYKAAELAVKGFGAYHDWASGYGGKAWENIAKSIFNLIKLSKDLDKIKKETTELNELIKIRANEHGKKIDEYGNEIDSNIIWKMLEEAYLKKINIMKDIIIEMNIFDGLSHNSDTIMSNLIREERLESNKLYSYEDDLHDNEFEKIIKLMDAKELENPIDVYREIKDSLGGELAKYRKYDRAIKMSPSFYKYDENKILEEKILIRLRKSSAYIHKYIKKIKDANTALKNTPIFMEKNININSAKELAGLISSWWITIKYTTRNLVENIISLIDTIRFNYEQQGHNINFFFEKRKPLLTDLDYKLDNICNTIELYYSDIITLSYENKKDDDYISRISYIRDSIKIKINEIEDLISKAIIESGI